jgi:TRAP-type C4-dicarboxylate transport system substrate-binding protein
VPGFGRNQGISNQIVARLFAEFPEVYQGQFSPRVKHIASGTSLRNFFHSTKPVRNLDDLEGMVIGSTSAIGAEAFQTLGISGTQMVWQDIPTAGERGVIDGVMAAWGGYNIFGLHEIFEYHTDISIGQGLYHWMFNLETWNKFTEEEQAQLELLGPWFVDWWSYGAIVVQELARASITGHESYQLSTEDRATLQDAWAPLADEWVEDMKAKGWPGEEIRARILELMSAYELG